MDREEFQTKANYPVTDDEYSKIEAVYTNAPSLLVGSTVTEFCRWFNKNGKMKAVDMLYPMANTISALRGQVHELSTLVEGGREQVKTLNLEKEVLENQVKTCQKSIRLYESLVTDEMLDEAISKMARAEKLRLIANSYGVTE